MEKPIRFDYSPGRMGEMDFNDDNRKYIDQLEAQIESHSLKNESKLRVLLSNKIESLKSENEELINGLANLMKGIDGLPSLTVIQ